MTPDDEKLIQKVSLRATGADIHDVNSIIGGFNVCLDMLSHENDLSRFNKKFARMCFGEMVIILSMYADGRGSISELKKKYRTKDLDLKIIANYVREVYTGDWDKDAAQLIEWGVIDSKEETWGNSRDFKCVKKTYADIAAEKEQRS